MLHIACVGDSLTEGYPITLGSLSWPAKLNMDLGPMWIVRNSGIRAFTMELLKPTAVSIAGSVGEAADAIRLMIFQGGTNDLVAGHTAAAMMEDVEDVVTTIQGLGWTVFTVTVPPEGANQFSDEVRLNYNDLLRAEFGGATRLIDWAADARLSDPFNETYFYDGDLTHFTEAGNAVCAELALAQIEAEFGTIYGRGFQLRG